MKISKRHPDRSEMLEAVKTGKVPFEAHLEECETCRAMYQLLQQFASIEGEATLDTGIAQTSGYELEPPRESIYRHRAIARLIESRNPASSLGGGVVFDSWAHLPAVQVRDAAVEGERRIRLKADRYTLELIGDKQLDRWEFVARVYEGRKVSSEFILQVGRKKLYAKSQSCFFWTAKQPPRKIQLLSPSVRIDFGTIDW